MNLNKKVFFRIHSWIGIKLSILFFIVCLSGTLSTLSHEMDWLFNPDIRASPQVSLASKEEIIDNIKLKYPEGNITFWRASVEPYLCDVVYLNIHGNRKYVFVNPYTGSVQGETNLTIQRFFRDLHYYLFIPFQVGHFTVLVFGFMLFISTVTALVFYKKWWKKLFYLKTGNGPVILFRSLHRLVGIWSIPFTILFSITGIWYFMERTNTASISDTANIEMPKIDELNIDSAAFAKIHYTILYDEAVKAAERAIPGLVVKDIQPPSKKTSPIYITGKSKVPLVRNRANRVYIHPLTYEIVSVQNAKTLTAVTWLNDIADPLHFGNWGGLTTKIIWFLGGLGITFLVGTGIWISLKRRIKNTQKAKNQQLGRWKYLNILVMLSLYGFMYHILFSRYSISLSQFCVITLCWILLLFLAWLIYVKKINKQGGNARIPSSKRL